MWIQWWESKWVKVFKNEPSKIFWRQPWKIWSDIVCLSRPYHFKFFKGCLPQILLGSFFNTLTQIIFQVYLISADQVVFIRTARKLLKLLEMIVSDEMASKYNTFINCYNFSEKKIKHLKIFPFFPLRCLTYKIWWNFCKMGKLKSRTVYLQFTFCFEDHLKIQKL